MRDGLHRINQRASSLSTMQANRLNYVLVSCLSLLAVSLVVLHMSARGKATIFFTHLPFPLFQKVHFLRNVRISVRILMSA
jgi:hypothetical protein